MKQVHTTLPVVTLSTILADNAWSLVSEQPTVVNVTEDAAKIIAEKEAKEAHTKEVALLDVTSSTYTPMEHNLRVLDTLSVEDVSVIVYKTADSPVFNSLVYYGTVTTEEATALVESTTDSDIEVLEVIVPLW